MRYSVQCQITFTFDTDDYEDDFGSDDSEPNVDHTDKAALVDWVQDGVENGDLLSTEGYEVVSLSVDKAKDEKGA